MQLQIGTSGWQEADDTLMIFSVSNLPANLSYTVNSQDPDPTAAEIGNAPAPTSIVSEYGTYAGPHVNQLRAIADQATRGASTELQMAQDLQTWFTSGRFTYTLNTGLPKTDWLLQFLTTGRRGFCTQFAEAFAVLARQLGIPSRVAVGFTAGSNSRGDWHVTTADAHAWPELFFAGVGWLRFEPTPGGPTGQGSAYPPAYSGGQTVGGSPSTQGQQPGTAPSVAPSFLGGHNRPPANNRFSHEGFAENPKSAAARPRSPGCISGSASRF